MDLREANVKNYVKPPTLDGDNKFIIKGSSQVGESIKNTLSSNVISLLHPDITVANLSVFYTANKQYQFREIILQLNEFVNNETTVYFYKNIGGSTTLIISLNLTTIFPPGLPVIIPYSSFINKPAAVFSGNGSTFQIKTNGAATNSPVSMNISAEYSYIIY